MVHGPLSVAILGRAYNGLWSMVNFPLAILGHGYNGRPWSTFRWLYSCVDTMDYSPWSTSIGHAAMSIPWIIVHGLLSVGHSRQSIPWTIFHGQLSVDHTLMSIPWIIVHGPLSVGGRYHRLYSMVHFPLATLGCR